MRRLLSFHADRVKIFRLRELIQTFKTSVLHETGLQNTFSLSFSINKQSKTMNPRVHFSYSVLKVFNLV